MDIALKAFEPTLLPSHIPSERLACPQRDKNRQNVCKARSSEEPSQSRTRRRRNHQYECLERLNWRSTHRKGRQILVLVRLSLNVGVT